MDADDISGHDNSITIDTIGQRLTTIFNRMNKPAVAATPACINGVVLHQFKNV